MASALSPYMRTYPSQVMLLPRVLAGVPLLILGAKHFFDPEPFRQVMLATGFPYVDFHMVAAPIAEVLAGILLLAGLVARLGGLLGMATMIPALYATLTIDMLDPAHLPVGVTAVPFVPPWPLPLAVFLCALAVFCEGAGIWSLDEKLTARRTVPENAPKVVIIGGGFAGLYAARQLGDVPVHVTLIDRRNFHLFQPLLYQVATGALSPANIAAPLRSVLKRQLNAKVLLAEVTELDLPNRQVVLSDGRISYDYLIVAAGARHAYFGHPEWEQSAPGLKTIEDATEIRRRVLWAFEMAERAEEPALRRRWLTFVVVGAGPTGVELAGAIAELAHHTLRDDFRRIDPAEARVLLVEGTDRVLGAFHPKLSEEARNRLVNMGVEVRLGSFVTDLQDHQVTVKHGAQTEVIETATVIWAAGVQASPLAAALGQATGAAIDRAGRVAVEPDLTLPGRPEVFAIGDMVLVNQKNGAPVPGVAPAAMQMGRYVARTIARRLKGKTNQPFSYFDKGSMATIGRAAAVVETQGIRLTGMIAWLAWLVIHLMFLVQFENRLAVLWQWFWSYVTRNRTARLITDGRASRTVDVYPAGVKEMKDEVKPTVASEANN